MSDLGVGLKVAGSQLESLGHALVERLGPLNVFTAALLGGALLLDRALARRARASWRIALYAPVALRVVLPLDWSLPLANAPRVATLFAPLQRIGARSILEPSAWHAPSWYTLAAVIYVAVVVELATRAIVARVRLGRSLADARHAPDLQGGVPCPVVVHDELGPMAVGLLAPRVVIPRRLLVAGEEHALACVLRHEAAHQRRGDAWLSTAMQVLATVAWPVLPLWIAIARVRQLVELACDEAALAGADVIERRRYGHALLDIAEWRSLQVAPLGAGELHFGSTLRARIEALGSQRHWPLAVQALALSMSALTLLLACGGSASRPPASASSGPTAPGNDREGYGYAFEVDPAKTGAAAPASPPSPIAIADGRIPPETIQAAVRAHFGAFQRCYEAGLKNDPKLTGTVNVKYGFGEDGVTTGVVDENSTLPDKAVIGCVLGEFRKITYPKAKAGVVTVVYPVEFSP